MESVPVLVVGGGSAGLSVSHALTALAIDHVVLVRGRIGQAWRSRWDSFCLVTPNWSVRLPGGSYAGDDPDGFMPRDHIVAHLVRYATASRAPVREGVEVRTIDRMADYRSWLPVPDALDEVGFPLQRDGASTVVEGLSFVGVYFVRTRKSSNLLGVGEDATIVARSIAAALAR